jgi:hypothetical protein
MDIHKGNNTSILADMLADVKVGNLAMIQILSFLT